MKSLSIVASILAASALGVSLFGGMSKAQAQSLVPLAEGEIQTNIACVTASCIDTTSLGYKVISRNYSPAYQASLLFSDDSETPNNWVFGLNFLGVDAGTNSENGNWFRPVAVNLDGSYAEDGQLEVGQFTFDFLGQTISELALTFFDVEDGGTTVLKVNGADFYLPIASGPDSNLNTVTLTNVSSFDVQLGKIGGIFSTGDGVRLQVAVPEPGVFLGLGGLAIASVFGLRQRKKVAA